MRTLLYICLCIWIEFVIISISPNDSILMLLSVLNGFLVSVFHNLRKKT